MEEITENEKIKKLERDNLILRYQNDRLLKYLRANKIFYKKRLNDYQHTNNSLQKQLEDHKTQFINNQRSKNEDIQN